MEFQSYTNRRGEWTFSKEFNRRVVVGVRSKRPQQWVATGLHTLAVEEMMAAVVVGYHKVGVKAGVVKVLVGVGTRKCKGEKVAVMKVMGVEGNCKCMVVMGVEMVMGVVVGIHNGLVEKVEGEMVGVESSM
ncbi:hypothetical protein QJS10_CPA10g00515 [Acorus calamus]|uniref:Uncharacterized protein n=1 Tax=Acorus calamus TaxID=4465 RepID=A0AAV9DXP5_ACOCL|nr:hypothetical protein QJS10_CPA10g00515 [Acorus calamus]